MQIMYKTCTLYFTKQTRTLYNLELYGIHLNMYMNKNMTIRYKIGIMCCTKLTRTSINDEVTWNLIKHQLYFKGPIVLDGIQAP